MALLQTPAQRKVLAFKPQAMAGHWSARRFSKEAGISVPFAAKTLAEWHKRNVTALDKKLDHKLDDLASVARDVRNADIALLRRLVGLTNRAATQLELSEDLDVKELDTLTGAIAKRWKHTEALTGLDVAKQIAVRKEAMKDGQPIAWDGVAEIEARPIECLALPSSEPDETEALLEGL
jgi:hypothetical protein